MKRVKLMSTSILILMAAISYRGECQSSEPGNKPGLSYKLAADIVSSYIWRGTVGTWDPSIQPSLALVAGNFEAGVWGSTNFQGTYREVDPYLSYTLKSFRFTFSDYNWIFSTPSYFNYKKNETDHILEATAAFSGNESFPVGISVSTMLYGADKKYIADVQNPEPEQNFSTYIELNYILGPATFFLGVTPWDGYYGDGYGNKSGFGFCNAGVAAARNIKITSDFSLPVKGSLGVNPQDGSIYFFVGFTL
jgi:hypothetical protein